MKRHPGILLAICAFLLGGGILSAQDERSPRDLAIAQMDTTGTCCELAMTRTQGWVMVYDKGWAAFDAPDACKSFMRSATKGGLVVRVCRVTESGNWMVIAGSNAFSYTKDIPQDLKTKLMEMNKAGKYITSADFNDYDEWILLSGKDVFASDEATAQWIKDGAAQYGRPLSVCLTEDATIVVFTGGYLSRGYVPAALKAWLAQPPFRIDCVRVFGDYWFIANGQGKYRCDLGDGPKSN